MTRIISCAACLFVLAAACYPQKSETSSETNASSSTTSVSSTTKASTSTTNSGTSTDTGGACEGDPALVGECDFWCQDCPKGEKCILTGSEPGNIGLWVNTKCQPIAQAPKAVGEACTILENTTEWIDDCEDGAICMWWDNEGPRCESICGGEFSDPSCDGAKRCVMYLHLPLCAPLCDPLDSYSGCSGACKVLDQSCGDCYPTTSKGTITCGLESNSKAGELCYFHSHCQGGLFCGPGDRVPDCSDEKCCTPFCDINDPTCEQGLQCAPAFEPGGAPAGMEYVGVCLLP